MVYLSLQFWFPDEGFEFDCKFPPPLTIFVYEKLLPTLTLSRPLTNSRSTSHASPRAVSNLATGVSREAYYYSSGPQQYAFSFCNNIGNVLCDDGNGGKVATSSMELKPVVGNCAQSFGDVSNTSAKLLATNPSEGLTVTYSGGPPCSDYSPAYSTFNLLCDPSAGFNITGLTVIKQNCAIEITARSAAGCPYRKTLVYTPLGGGYIAAIVLVSTLSLYCAVGMGVKRYRQGTSGIESVPHIESLRAVYSRIGSAVSRLRGSPGDSSSDYFTAPGAEDDFT